MVGTNKTIETDNDLDLRRNAAAKRFLKAVERYRSVGRRDGKFIVNNYLKKFDKDDKDRAEIVVKIAEETSREIEDFNSHLCSLSERVNLVLQSSEIVDLSGQIESIGEILTTFSDNLNKISLGISKREPFDPSLSSTSELEKKIEIINTKVAQKFETVIFVANTASEIVEARCDTLRDFKDNNLYASRKVFIDRLRKIIANAPKETAFSTFKYVANKVLDQVLENAPVVRWLFWAKKHLDKIISPVGTKAGDTDIMLKLLPELKKTTSLFNELETAYRASLPVESAAPSKS